jgi:CheY-like chemotaxis protein
MLCTGAHYLKIVGMPDLQARIPGGSELVLLVEPEPETRKLAVFMLSKQGYRVLEARNAQDAFQIYESAGTVDLLLTEAAMPRMNGHELAARLEARQPGLRVLYLSDAEYARLARKEALRKGITFLERPFTMGTISGKVREVLDSGSSKRVSVAGLWIH